MNESTSTVVAELVEDFASMSKQEMWKHLTTFHRYSSRINSKTTKASMIEWHSDEHAVADLLVGEGTRIEPRDLVPGEDGWIDTRRLQQIVANDPELQAKLKEMHAYNIPTFKVWHTHVDAVVAENVAAAALAVREGTVERDNTPIASLSATERKALKDVVDNDFNMLKQEMRSMAALMEKQRLAEVTESWAKKQEDARKFVLKAEGLIRKQQTARSALVEEARKAGVTLTMPESSTLGIKSEAEGFAEALRDAKADVQRELDTAMLTLERQRLTAQRTVLLTGVSGEVAQTVLGAIPDAKTMMMQAAAAQSVPAIES